MKAIYQKLLTLQKCIGGLAKDTKGNNYQYVSGTKLLCSIRPKMDELGLILKQEVLSIENERQDYSTAKGSAKSEILSKVMMRFTWIDTETGEADENTFGANGQNDWEKGLGSALTYAERYFILKYFHIPTDEDDIDNTGRKPEPQPSQAPQPAKPSPQIDESYLAVAIDDINRASSMQELQSAWVTHKAAQGVQSFVRAKDERKRFLTTNQQQSA